MIYGDRVRLGVLRGLLVGVVTTLLITGCGSDGDRVPASKLPAQPPSVTGPSYVLLRPESRSTVRVGDASREVSRLDGAQWLPNGDLLVVSHSTVRRNRSWIRVVDPVTFEPRGPKRRFPGEARVTPEGITTVNGLKIHVYPLDLSKERVIKVDSDDVETDQLGKYAEFALASQARILGGAIWVEWYVNSENDELTDHGLLRIDGSSRVDEVQRNTPISRVYTSDDGAALLLLVQDKGDEDCGGCTVKQHIAELDPDTGKVMGEYGMPDGYDAGWRVFDVDKADDEVVVNFIGKGVKLSTWKYDGEWSEVTSARDTLTRWQPSQADPDSRLIVRQSTRNDEGTLFFWPYSLTWESDGDADEVLSEADSCGQVLRDKVCTDLIMPGSLLPTG